MARRVSSVAARWLAAGLLAAAGPVLAGDGLYVWDEAVRMTDGRVHDGEDDRTAQQRLLRFCTAPGVGVTRLYLLADPAAWDPASLGALLDAAAAEGIDVYAVPSGALQDEWVRPFLRDRRCDHDAVLDWARRIAAFNRRAPGAGFRGLQLDIEPHTARARRWLGGRRPVWRAGGGGLLRDRRNRRLARQYLVLLDRVRETLDQHDPALRLAVTLPTWLDRDTRRESYRLRYAGRSKVLAHHVLDRVDFVTLMNYVDGSGDRDEAWREIAGELRYGPVEAMFETAPPGRRGSAPRRHRTLYHKGERRYRELRERLAARFDGDPNFIGCGVHHYLRSYGSGRRGWPAHARAEPH